MLAVQFEFDPAHDSELLAQVAAAPGVFLLRGDVGSEPYVGKCANVRRRLQRLLGPPLENTKRINLREKIHQVEYSLSGSDFESAFLLYRLQRACFPQTYAERLHLRFAPFVKLHFGNPYPRASITTRLAAQGRSLYYGPFPSRGAAEHFVNDSLDFFRLRRCVEDLSPDPAFPGCIYSEMKMCLAPCFRGCTDAEYAAESAKVKAFFDSSGESLLKELLRQREAASSALDFEAASETHARLVKLKPVIAQLPEIVRRFDLLNALVVQPAVLPGCVNLFAINEGLLSEPMCFAFDPAQPVRAAEDRLADLLAAIPSMQNEDAVQTMEHVAILSRWYFRGTKTGEIFFADRSPQGEPVLPLRRLLRGIGRMLAPPSNP